MTADCDVLKDVKCKPRTISCARHKGNARFVGWHNHEICFSLCMRALQLGLHAFALFDAEKLTADHPVKSIAFMVMS